MAVPSREKTGGVSFRDLSCEDELIGSSGVN